MDSSKEGHGTAAKQPINKLYGFARKRTIGASLTCPASAEHCKNSLDLDLHPQERRSEGFALSITAQRDGPAAVKGVVEDEV